MNIAALWVRGRCVRTRVLHVFGFSWLYEFSGHTFPQRLNRISGSMPQHRNRNGLAWLRPLDGSYMGLRIILIIANRYCIRWMSFHQLVPFLLFDVCSVPWWILNKRYHCRKQYSDCITTLVFRECVYFYWGLPATKCCWWFPGVFEQAMGRFVQDMLSEEVFWISGKLPLRYVSSCMSRIFYFFF